MSDSIEPSLIAARSFSQADQIEFAELSGDHNPVHLDEQFARRTLFGRPIVHGMHIALWMLDRFAAAAPARLPFRNLTVRFNRPLFLDEAVVVHARQVAGGVDLHCTSDGALLTQMKLTEPAATTRRAWTPCRGSWSRTPADSSLESMTDRRGDLALPYEEAAMAGRFPRALDAYGAAPIAHLLALTRVVGMEVPGLHSLFGGFSAQLKEGSGAHLKFSVLRFNSKTSHVQIQFDSEVLAARADTFVRPQSAAMQYPEAARGVRPGEFAGRRSLVIGGSRGLGLVTAFALGAGGADVVLTYRVGRAEAEAAAAAIRGAGGQAAAVALDAASPAEGFDTLGRRGFVPTELYYFATPHIFERKKALFEAGLFDRFVKCYVTDFAGIVDSCLALSPPSLAVFYPSSDALNNPVKELMEYSAAKAAGEAFCDMLQRFSPQVSVWTSRLPRLPTDQTATLMKISSADPVAVMLDACRKMGSLPTRLPA